MAATATSSVRARVRLPWPDVIRLLAMAAIFVYHFSYYYSGLAGEPNSRTHFFIAAHFAEWGIAAFVVLAGFSLAYTCLTTARSYREWAARRLTRLLAPYWTVAVPFIVVGFALAEAPLSEWWKVPIWLLGLGPVSRATYLPISQVWWFVSLALQISLVMPLLVKSYRRRGPIVTTIAALAINYLSMVAIGVPGGRWGYLAQGLVFARLGEVMVGVIAASVVIGRRKGNEGLVRDLASMALLLAAMPVVYRLGWPTSWTPVVALGVVFLICAVFGSSPRREHHWLAVLASYTYCFYLTHAPVTKYTLQALFGKGIERLELVLPIVLAVTIAVAWAAETLTRRYAGPALDLVVRRLLSLPPRQSRTQ